MTQLRIDMINSCELLTGKYSYLIFLKVDIKIFDALT